MAAHFPSHPHQRPSKVQPTLFLFHTHAWILTKKDSNNSLYPRASEAVVQLPPQPPPIWKIGYWTKITEYGGGGDF